MGVNREYKNSLFINLFIESIRRIELYNAISGNNLPLDTPVEDATLSGALYMELLNDLAFIIEGKLVVLVEHQSTINANMPLRLLLYIAEIYQSVLDKKTLYWSRLQKIPRPEFYVLYNGKEKFPDKKILKLSDAFEAHSALKERAQGSLLELEVPVININWGRNKDILQKSDYLNGYAQFIGQVRGYQNSGFSSEEAVAKTIKYCINQRILVDFLNRNAQEVLNMLTAEFDLELAREVWREEALEEGIEIGREEGREEGLIKVAAKLLADGFALEQIVEITDLSIERIMAIQNAVN